MRLEAVPFYSALSRPRPTSAAKMQPRGQQIGLAGSKLFALCRSSDSSVGSIGENSADTRLHTPPPHPASKLELELDRLACCTGPANDTHPEMLLCAISGALEHDAASLISTALLLSFARRHNVLSSACC